MTFCCKRSGAGPVGRVCGNRVAVPFAALLGLIAPPALAADLPYWAAPIPVAPYYRWDGGYFGGHVGYVHGSSDFSLTGFPSGGFSGIIPPVPTSTSATTDGFIGGFQAGYMRQFDAFVFGFEQDIMIGAPSGQVISTGTASGFPFAMTQQQEIDWLATMRARVGFAPNDQFMVYATGGLAVGGVKTSTNLTFQPSGLAFANISNDFRTGWAAGAGVEYALTSQFSVSLDYLHFSLGDVTVVGLPNVPTQIETHTTASLSGDIVRAGLNYRFDTEDTRLVARDVGRFMPGFVHLPDTEIGLRTWYSMGHTAENLYDQSGSALVSRLTYGDLGAISAEGFLRIDDRNSGLFAKGFIGAGVINSGNLKDEDFPPGISPYSSTNSAQHGGNLLYFSGDLGYDLWHGPNYKLGVFSGIFDEHEVLNAYGCTQTATNPAVCSPAISSQILGIANDARWLAARFGLNGEVTLGNRFKLSVDAAWLPYVSLNNSDTHWLRTQPVSGNFLGPIPEDGIGHNGVQIEAIVSYLISPTFSVGVGARYWRMEINGATHFENNIADGGGLQQVNNWVTERYGGFLQGAFKF
jgi:opacity protein-like surface antigen